MFTTTIVFHDTTFIKMSTIALIKEAIIALKDRTGSSTIAITKWIETEKKVRLGNELLSQRS